MNRINGICGYCPLGTQYSSSSAYCMSNCGQNEVYSINGCICNQGYVKIGNMCGQCPSGTTYVSQTTSCVNSVSLSCLST